MRLNITIDDDQAAAVAERAAEANCTRVEWIRRAVSAALNTGLYRLGTLDVSEPVPAPCLSVPDRVPALEEQIRVREAQIVDLQAQVRAAVLRADLSDREARHIEERRQDLLVLRERLEDQVQGLKATITHYEGEYVRLTAALPERAGPSRPWWKFW